MMTELLRSTLLAAVLMLAGAGPALASKGDRAAAGFEITEAQALEIARGQGIAAVRDVKARRGVWKFTGVDDDGVDLELEIDSFTGEVLKIERYGMPVQG